MTATIPGANLTYTAVPATPGYSPSDHSIAWEFDDGASASTPSTIKAWSTVGAHAATVVATNNKTGGKAKASKVVNVMGGAASSHSLNIGRAYAEAILLGNGKVLIVGGFNGWKGSYEANVGMTSCELYDPTTGLFTPTGSLAQGRGMGHRLALLPNGDVLVVGGRNAGQNNVAWSVFGGSESDNRSSCEIYSVANGTWSSTGALPIGTRDHAIAVLPSGKVMIFGGAVATQATVANTYIYNPSLGTWSAGPALPKDLWGATALRLNDGRIFLTGGYSTVASPGTAWNASSYIYTEGGSYSICAIYPPIIGPDYTGQIRSITTPVLAQFGDSVIVCGGFNNSASDYQRYNYKYSLANNTWDQLAYDTAGSSFSQCHGCKIPDGIFYVGTVVSTGPRVVSGAGIVVLNSVVKTMWGSTVTYMNNGYVLVCGGADNLSYQIAIQDSYTYFVGI